MAINAYIEFLKLGGEIKFGDLTSSLISDYLLAGVPILTGLSATFLYKSPREYGKNSTADDIRGEPQGHFVVLTSYDPEENAGLTVSDLEQNTQRFRQVPSAAPADMLGDMQAFAAQLTDVQLKESLDLALSAPRPDRRFRAALGWLPDELDRWHSFRQRQCEDRATVWLETLGITPTYRDVVTLS